MIKFEFINHSCFSVSYNNISLTVDPWLEGTVFNKSWNLLVETPEKSLNTVKNSDFIWFSHEHPDHFNPLNIKLLPLEKKYLFQKTSDRRVVKYLSNFSNSVSEIDSDQTFKLTDNFFIQVLPFQDLDSFCIIKVGDKTILNLNDCLIKSKKELDIIKQKSGNIDVLFAQFSYAIGKSNKNDKYKRQSLSKEILENLNRSISHLKPRKVVPFASFCYFSRDDNFYLNDSINKIGDTIDFLSKKNKNIDFLCFYPGDRWDLSSNWNNKDSINKYNFDYNKITPIKHENKKVDIKNLKDAAYKFISVTENKNNLFNFYKFFNANFYKIFFKLTDANINLSFDFKNGINEISHINEKMPYCELTSESLSQLFLSGYGYDALVIGGRYESNKFGDKCLNKIFKFQTKNYQNHFYNFKDIIPRLLTKFSKYSRVIPKR